MGFIYYYFIKKPVSVYLFESLSRIGSDPAENGIIRQLVFEFIDVARIVARIVKALVDVLVIFGHKINVVEEKAVETI